MSLTKLSVKLHKFTSLWLFCLIGNYSILIVYLWKKWVFPFHLKVEVHVFLNLLV